MPSVLRTLVVGTTPAIRDTIALLVELERHHCEVASCRKEVSRFIQKTQFDLLITEWPLDEAEGESLAETLEKLSREIPILAVTNEGILPPWASAALPLPFSLEERLRELRTKAAHLGRRLPRGVPASSGRTRSQKSVLKDHIRRSA